MNLRRMLLGSVLISTLLFPLVSVAQSECEDQLGQECVTTLSCDCGDIFFAANGCDTVDCWDVIPVDPYVDWCGESWCMDVP